MSYRKMTDADAMALLCDIDCSVGVYADCGCLVELHIPEGNFSNAYTLFEVLEVLWRRKERQRRNAACLQADDAGASGLHQPRGGWPVSTPEQRAEQWATKTAPAARPCCRRALIRGYLAGWRARSALWQRALSSLKRVSDHLSSQLECVEHGQDS